MDHMKTAKTIRAAANKGFSAGEVFYAEFGPFETYDEALEQAVEAAVEHGFAPFEVTLQATLAQADAVAVAADAFVQSFIAVTFER